MSTVLIVVISDRANQLAEESEGAAARGERARRHGQKADEIEENL